MRIVLVGPGISPIPPVGYGACETIVWNTFLFLKDKDHDVLIVNESEKDRIVSQTNAFNPDFVHIMFDSHFDVIHRINGNAVVAYTSHWGFLTCENIFKASSYKKNVFDSVVRLARHKRKLHLFVLSSQIGAFYAQSGVPRQKIFVTPNGARDDLINFAAQCKAPHLSIYIGLIERRKRQYLFQTIPNIDFVGPYADSTFDITKSNYLGGWDRATLSANLTNYANLVLLSSGEAAPLVVIEALMAGLGVVVSQYACANLDLSKPFIHVIPESKILDLAHVQQVIAANREYAVLHREEIHDYAVSQFGLSKLLSAYEQTIQKLVVN